MNRNADSGYAVPSETGLDRRFLLGGLAGAAGMTALAAMAKAGPLSPPAGGIASTGKTLGEVEPRIAMSPATTPGDANTVFRITQPGSYYLTSDLVVPASMPFGITVSASLVTVDLNGFSIRAASSASITALLVALGVTGTVVRNGGVQGFQRGLSPGLDATVQDVTVTGSASRGILAAGQLVVRRCRVTDSMVGIECEGERAVIEDSLITFCSGIGIYVNTSSVLRNVHVVGGSGGAGTGAGGAYLGTFGRAESCSFTQCTQTGLDVSGGPGSTVVDCSFASVPTGLRLAAACRAIGCSFDSHSTAAVKISGSSTLVDSCTFSRSAVGVDMLNVSGNLVQRSTMLGVSNAVAVNIGGNWYPGVPLGGVNGNTNPSANVFG